MRRTLTIALSAAVIVTGLALASLHAAAQAPAAKTGNLILRGDMTYFFGPGKPKNCTLNNVYHKGEPVGWRIEAVDPETGQHVEPEAKLIVHITFGGKDRDLLFITASKGLYSMRMAVKGVDSQ